MFDSIVLFVGDGEFLTAFCSASGENVASALGFHAGEEAVRFGSFAFVRLICAFRHDQHLLVR